MTDLKRLVATATLMGIIIIGTTNANAGILMSDATSGNQCIEEKADKVDYGIIITNLKSILSIFTKNETREDCGIIITNN